MKNKIQSILSFFSLLLILSTSCKAQTIKARKLVKNTDAALNSIETKIFRIDRKVMPFSKSDTIQTTAICSLKVNREDIVAAAYHKIDVLGAKNNYTFTKYDGNNLLISRSTLDSLSYPSKTHIINKEDNNFLSYIYGFDDYLIMGHYETKRPFKKINSLIAKFSFIKRMNLKKIIIIVNLFNIFSFSTII